MRAAMRVAGLFLTMLFSGQSLAAYQLNLHPGVTSFSQGAYNIHQMVMWICVVIGIVVFGAMIYSIIYHRKSRGAVAADFHESTTVEILWTIVPFIILIVMAIPATRVLLEMEDVSGADMSIKVTGYRWKWHYDYNVGEQPQEIGFFSNLSTPREEIENKATKGEHYLLEVDNPLIVPVNQKVRLLFTANDVIHAWWVPAFGVKKDAIPGYINESWIKTDQPGIYRGQCAELCGKDHGFMPIVVEVKSEADYLAWLDSKKADAEQAAASSDKTWSMDELMAAGEKAYNVGCAGCHQANGEGLPAAGFPALKGSAVATGAIAEHIGTVMNGKGAIMPAFAGQLSDADLAAIITYERNAWGNNKGDMVQPSEIKALR